jgi:SPP1 family predicted phage head-tail adaptor
MNIGKLRHRVEIQALIVEIDSDGAQVETWVNQYSDKVWADIQPLSGREIIASQAVHSKVSARIVIRYKEFIVPSMRVLHRDKIYNISAIIPDSHSGKEYLTLLCTYGVNEG